MKKSSLIILFIAVFLWVGQAMAVPVVDGNFGLNEWAGHYAVDHNFVGEWGFVNPGWGGQAYDVEYTGLYFDSTTLYFGLQTGFDLVSGTSKYKPGDFALDVNGDGDFDYAINYSVTNFDSVTGSGDVTYFLVDMSTETPTKYWEGAIYNDSSPWQAFYYDSDVVLSWTMSNALGLGNNLDGEKSYVLEGSLSMSLLAAYSGGSITNHWTMECGNDVGEITSAPVPEPATMLLFGTGLVGIAAIGRKRKKFVG